MNRDEKNESKSGCQHWSDREIDEAPGNTITMYRPVGRKELDLVQKAGFKKWPPRLLEQPIFYPVTNERYAIEITERWNAKEEGIGYVTRFRVRREFMDRYDIHKVGASYHTEWWIPSNDLEELNQNIVGLIEIVGEYHKDNMR